MSERDETREAVARAIYEDRNGLHCQPWAKVSGQRREDYTSHATAALKALTPGSRFSVEGVECVVAPVQASKAMVDSGVAFALNVSISSDYNWSSYVADLHSAMLRACEEKGDG